MRYGFIKDNRCVNVGEFETELSVLEIRSVFIPSQIDTLVLCPDSFGIGDIYENETWFHGTPKPSPLTPDEKIEALSTENKLLKAQIQAQTDRSDFVEDCIAEMATMVYA